MLLLLARLGLAWGSRFLPKMVSIRSLFLPCLLCLLCSFCLPRLPRLLCLLRLLCLVVFLEPGRLAFLLSWVTQPVAHLCRPKYKIRCRSAS